MHKHRNNTFKVLLEHNDHCSAVEVLYYMTHCYFRSEQDFTPRNPQRSYPEFRFRMPSSALHPPPSADNTQKHHPIQVAQRSSEQLQHDTDVNGGKQSNQAVSSNPTSCG